MLSEYAQTAAEYTQEQASSTVPVSAWKYGTVRENPHTKNMMEL